MRDLITVLWYFSGSLVHQDFPDVLVKVHEVSAVPKDHAVLGLTWFVG